MAPRAHQKGSVQLAVEVSDILISGYSNRRPENEIRNDVVMAITAALTLDLGLTVGFIKSPPMQTPEILVSPMRFIRTKYEDRQIPEFIDRFADYALGLGAAIDKNRGLDHSKVREYWLERGPRILPSCFLPLPSFVKRFSGLGTKPGEAMTEAISAGQTVQCWVLQIALNRRLATISRRATTT